MGGAIHIHQFAGSYIAGMALGERAGGGGGAIPAMYDPANWWMWMAPPIAAGGFCPYRWEWPRKRFKAQRKHVMAMVKGRA